MVKKIFFSPLKFTWNLNIKVINITNLVQVIFNAWFGYFEYVSYLQYGKMLIVLNQWVLSLITINFNLSTHHELLSSEKSLALNFTNHFWHIQSVTALSPYTAQIFPFEFQLCFYLSWNNKARCWKCCFSLPSSILKWPQKNSSTLMTFLKCTLIWQLSQYSLTKFFQMKLKTTKCY